MEILTLRPGALSLDDLPDGTARRSPMAIACVSAASCFSSIAAKRAYRGAIAARARACSA